MYEVIGLLIGYCVDLFVPVLLLVVAFMYRSSHSKRIYRLYDRKDVRGFRGYIQ